MKALIQNNVVIGLWDTPFEVHPDFVWVDCPENVVSGYTFTDGVFVPPAPLPERTYAEKRASEYPPITDYLDGVVKGDQAQIDAYIAACQAVKTKYPKPE